MWRRGLGLGRMVLNQPRGDGELGIVGVSTKPIEEEVCVGRRVLDSGVIGGHPAFTNLRCTQLEAI